jgi:hypothetical protein
MHAALAWLKEPAHASLVITSVLYLISDLMPFTKGKANGILQAIVLLLTKAKAAEDARTKQ